jgi:hypothetical protein
MLIRKGKLPTSTHGGLLQETLDIEKETIQALKKVSRLTLAGLSSSSA